MNVARELGERMCAAWGINPTECTAIEVHWTPFELPRAVVHLMLNEQVAYELLQLTVADRRPVDHDLRDLT